MTHPTTTSLAEFTDMVATAIRDRDHHRYNGEEVTIVHDHRGESLSVSAGGETRSFDLTYRDAKAIRKASSPDPSKRTDGMCRTCTRTLRPMLQALRADPIFGAFFGNPEDAAAEVVTA